MEKMLRKVYPGRPVECINSSQHNINHKIKGVNDDNGRLKRKKTLPRMTGKQKMKHRNVTLKLSIKGMMRNMTKARRILKPKKRKMWNQKKKEEEIKKNEEIVMVELSKKLQ